MLNIPHAVQTILNQLFFAELEIGNFSPKMGKRYFLALEI